ncbi:oxaloacetate decarboxylase [Gammaproteobacteria bacterium LSUCC0112]|nr:oxaloacetate decarboxylase [Gammaproteobacteria bacterium LSUCC0112]
MSDLVLSGLNLALYGMGFVFLFLLLLVGLTNLMSALVRRFSPAVTVALKQYSGSKKPGIERRAGTKPVSHSASDDKSRLIAIMSAAITQHRSDRS